MKYKFLCTTGILVAALLAANLSGCTPSKPVLATTSAEATITAAATKSAQPRPTVTSTPTPTPTVAETATAAPTPTQTPMVESFSPKDYYEVERNQRAGIVDKTGKEVLPCVFGEAQGLGTFDLENGNPVAQMPQTQFFLATAYVIHPGKPGTEAEHEGELSVARLYNAQGRVVGEGQYTSGYWLNHDLMALQAATKGNPMGVMDVTGKQIVPFQYSQVLLFGPYVVGCNATQGRLEFYTSDGVLDKTITAPVNSVYANKDFLQVNFQDTAALLDGSLQWLFKDSKYRNIQAVGDGRFLASDGTVSRLIDSAGKDLLGKAYQNIDTRLDANGQVDAYLCYSDALATVAVYDASCKPLFQKKGYSSLRAVGPYFIARDATGSRVLDAKGEQILVNLQGEVQEWLADKQAFLIYNREGTLTTLMKPDGTALPLPQGNNVQYLGDDRFLVSVDANHTGLCDSQGHWIIPADYVGLYAMNGVDKLLTATLGDGRTGLLDYDGKTVIPPVFDWVYGEQDGLLSARKGSRSGLMDWTGHWVWSTSDYEQLDD